MVDAPRDGVSGQWDDPRATVSPNESARRYCGDGTGWSNRVSAGENATLPRAGQTEPREVPSRERELQAS